MITAFSEAKAVIIHNFEQISFMDAVTILKNETNNHRLMQIDLDILAEDAEQLEDLYDILAVELRKNEETIPWEEVKKQLEEGKI